MKKKKLYIAVVVVVVLGTGIYYWRSKSNKSGGEAQYVTESAEKGTLTVSISASGNVTVDQLATVDPTITGTVANLAVKVGDPVAKGQFLFDIINDQLGVSVARSAASLEQARNSVESAELQKDQAEEDLKAAEKKDKADPTSFSKGQLEILEDKIEVAEDGVDLAKKNLSAAQADYRNQLADADERRVTAPISGTVNEINIKNGDDLGKISSSSTTRQSPVIIGDLDTLKAEVQVNEVDVSNIRVGQKAVLKLDAVDGLSVSGLVEKIDSLGTIDQGVVTYNVIIGFDTLDDRIKPEMSVSASIITDVVQDAVIVPSSAVKNDGNRDYVEVLVGTTPEQKAVTVGSSNNTSTEIKSGINPGDAVVTQTITQEDTATETGSSSRSGGFSLPGLGGGGAARGIR